MTKDYLLCHNQFMKLIVLSDSHGMKEPLEYIRNHYEDADCIIHCGDICLPKEYSEGFVIVAGNCDNPEWYPLAEIIELEGHRILITHGHVLFSSSSPNPEAIARLAKRNECDIAFFGHSHIYCDETFENVRVCNPGSISANRDATNPCFMEIDLEEDSMNVKRVDYNPFI